MSGAVVQFPRRPNHLLTKKQLAAELGRSTRWIELRMREGLPSAPRRSPTEHTRFELDVVTAWLAARATRPAPTLEQRVARLEAQLARLAEGQRDR